MVQVTKKTLAHVLAKTLIAEKPTMNYAELQTILAEVANVTNDCPIGIRNLTEEDLMPITPNHLLLGQVSTHNLTFNEQGNLIGLDRMKDYHKEILQSWWTMWKEQVFPKLFKYYDQAGAQEQVNLKVGDVCLLNYKTKVTSHFRLCVVLKANPSKDGVVRTV